MKILSIECSASPVSAAITEDGKILAYSFQNVKITHSQTLLPTVENLVKAAKLTLSDIDGISVAAGPGSFTGIRIGISAVKGLAQANNIPVVAVSTLLSMAYNFTDFDNTIICACMDARCNQVYNALFEIKNGSVQRLLEDRAISIDLLSDELSKIDKNIIICGDGADLVFEAVNKQKNIKIACENLKFQSALGVALASLDDFRNGKTITANELLPVYLRLPQAERELKAKEKNK